MKIKLISDTHFNHGSIVEFCGRPVDYERRLERSLSNLKRNKHVLIHLGDVCMGNDSEVHERYIKPIECRKILILGNHDHKSIAWYLEHGWDWVCESMVIMRGGLKVKFTHRPVAWDGEWDLNVHGHLHNLSYRESTSLVMEAFYRLVSLEIDGYNPIDLDKIIAEKKGTRNRNEDKEQESDV